MHALIICVIIILLNGCKHSNNQQYLAVNISGNAGLEVGGLSSVWLFTTVISSPMPVIGQTGNMLPNTPVAGLIVNKLFNLKPLL